MRVKLVFLLIAHTAYQLFLASLAVARGVEYMLPLSFLAVVGVAAVIGRELKKGEQ